MKHVPSSDDQARQVHLLNNLRTHYEELSRLQQEARTAYQRIDKEKDITSSQCTRIITPLLPSDHPVINLKNLLEHPLHFPSIDTQRQQLLIRLDQIDVCIQQLRQQATQFSQISFRPPIEETRKIRENILGTIQTIEQKLLDFNGLLIKILETAILQEQPGSPGVPNQSSTPLKEMSLPSSPPNSSSQSPIIEETYAPYPAQSYQSHSLLLIVSRIATFVMNIFSGMPNFLSQGLNLV